MWWLDEQGEEALSNDVNKWIGVIDYASLRIRASSTPGERKEFRDVAIAATSAGWNLRALPRKIYAEKQIYIRMSYIRSGGLDVPRKRQEMEQVMDFFLEQAPLIMESAREKSANWKERPSSIIVALREIKMLLGIMSAGAELLDDDRRKLLTEWLKIRPLLP
jgi:hypothetical protein